MIDPEAAAEDTGLTARQAEVLALRREGLTQTEIADRFGTSVANVSVIERVGREKVARARRTIVFAYRLDTICWFTVEAGTHVRDLVESVFEHGDEVDVKVTVSHPELQSYLEVQFHDRLDGRRLTGPVELGITPAGGVVSEPPELPQT